METKLWLPDDVQNIILHLANMIKYKLAFRCFLKYDSDNSRPRIIHLWQANRAMYNETDYSNFLNNDCKINYYFGRGEIILPILANFTT